MLRNRILGIAVIAAIAGSIAVEAACIKVGGIAAVVAINPKNTLGTVSGDLRGALLITSTTSQNPDGTFTTQGRMTFVGENPSDTMKANFSQHTLPTSQTTGFASVQATLTGGTGKFAGATGTLTAPSEVDFTTGLQSFRFSAEICTP